MDLATLIGLVGATAMVVVVMLLSGGLGMYWDLMSLLVVIGGAIFSTLIRWPLPLFIQGMIGISDVLFDKGQTPEKVINDVVEMADTARKSSILALEKVTVEYDFLAKGVRHMVDGYDADVINDILKIQMINKKNQFKTTQTILENMGESAPAFGMIGTVIGLVVIMANLSDPDAIGPGLAVALITTLYGALGANMVFMPLAGKIEYRGKQETTNMVIVLSGLNAMLKGQSPRAIQEQLEGYL